MKPLNFHPFPSLTSERLLLRKFKTSDDQEIFFLRSNPEVMKYIKREPEKHIDEAQAFIKKITTGIDNNEWISWAITKKESPELIGTICIWNFSKENNSGEIGYDLMPKQQGKGIMTEALKLVIEYGFKKLELDTLEAYTDERNQASIHLLLKNHFRHDTSRTDKHNEHNRIYILKNLIK